MFTPPLLLKLALSSFVIFPVGNPSTILAKQGGLTLIPINPCCTLYTASGRPVSQEKDARIEKEFNRILATTGYVASKDPDSARKSLGQVIEDLIR